MIKSRRMRWAGHVARMGKKRNACKILVGKPEGKRPLGRPRRIGGWGDPRAGLDVVKKFDRTGGPGNSEVWPLRLSSNLYCTVSTSFMQLFSYFSACVFSFRYKRFPLDITDAPWDVARDGHFTLYHENISRVAWSILQLLWIVSPRYLCADITIAWQQTERHSYKKVIYIRKHNIWIFRMAWNGFMSVTEE
jgi:hypothetical protein